MKRTQIRGIYLKIISLIVYFHSHDYEIEETTS